MIGRYHLIEFIGAGGMGEVYRASDQAGNPVAVKVLTAVQGAPALLARFRNEAQIHASLHHPHIAKMREFLLQEDTPAIVMEYVDGETLDTLLHRDGALPVPRALELAVPLIDALSHLHQRGIIHRDIKSSNVKVSAAGVIKLLDFGIAKGPGSPALTADGSVIGTLQSLAPEQLSGAPADQRSDIWSLGVVLYEMVTGSHPFATGDVATLTARIRSGRYQPASRLTPALSGGFDTIIDRCLRVPPRQRYGSMDALLRDVRSLGDPGLPIPAFVRRLPPGMPSAQVRSHAPRFAAIGAALALVAMLGWSLFGGSAPATPSQPATISPAAATTAEPGTLRTPAVGDVREVTIHTVNGVAEVWRNGAHVGQTPYRLRAAIGSEVGLELRRTGYRSETVEFTVTEGRREYSFVLRPHAGGRPQSRQSSPEPMIGLAWAMWPWRRRRTPEPVRLATADRPIIANSTQAAEHWVVVGMATDPGCARDNNEDAIRVVRPETTSLARDGLLAVVCDGMGGHAAGETASRIATEVIARDYPHPDDPGEGLRLAVAGANRAVYDAGRADAALTGMGTTCTALVLRGGLAWCAHVGDSRCYLLRDGEIFLMTEDHSAVMALVRGGAISREEAHDHPDKNVISRALGSHRDVEVTTWPRPFVVRPGDRFLLCSDGLHDVISEESVREAGLLIPPHEACRELVARTRAAGAPDNVSVILLVVPGSTGDPAVRTTRALDLPA